MSEEAKRSQLLFNSIDIHLADARREFLKLEEKQVKVAATRARKQLASVTEHIKELRKLALSTQKELPVAKRTEKPKEEPEPEEDSESEGDPPEAAKPAEKPKVRKRKTKKTKKPKEEEEEDDE